MTRLRRSFTLKSVEALQDSNDDLIRIAISTESPYLRTRLHGHKAAYEVLGHRANEVQMDYLQDGAPFLFEHQTDTQIGVLENVQLSNDGVLRADVRFSNSQFAQEILDDIKRGIRKRISVGYEVTSYEDAGSADDGLPLVRATQWMPYEASLVSIPADLNAGVGRARKAVKMLKEATDSATAPTFVFDDNDAIAEVILPDGTSLTDEAVVQAIAAAYYSDQPEASTDQATASEATQEEAPREDEAPQLAVPDAAPEAAPERADESADSTNDELFTLDTATADNAEKDPMNSEDKNETQRAATIVDLAVRHGQADKASEWIASGKTVEDVKDALLEVRSNTNKIGAPALHLTKRDESFTGAVKSFLRGDKSELAEQGIDQARSFGSTIEAGVLYLPTNVPMFGAQHVRSAFAKRDATYGMGGTGANLTGKEYFTFEETLREGSLLTRVGGEIRSLNDIGSMPYFSTATTASMYAETGSVSNASVEVGLRSWTPKRIAARYEFSNLMGALNGTYDIEGELYNDLVAEGVRQLDAQIWGGTGANNITGLAYDTSIATFGGSGSFALSSGSALITEVAKRNGNVDAGTFVVSHDVYSVMFSTPFANGGATVLSALQASNPVYRTGFLPIISTKNVAIFGDFSKVTAATFGPVQITRDNLTALASGKTVLNFELFADSVARQPAALIKWTNITP